MRTRLELSTILNSIEGPKKVYHQPANNMVLEYPCIIYELDRYDIHFADDSKYLGKKRYNIEIIDERPSSPIVDEVLKLPFTSFDRTFVNDRLYHYVVTLYF